MDGCGSYLLKGGLLTLIKRTVFALSSYYLSLFPIPLSLANHVEKLWWDFLWRGNGKVAKFHLFGWIKIHTGSHRRVGSWSLFGV